MSDDSAERVSQMWFLGALWFIVAVMLITDAVADLPRDFAPLVGIAVAISACSVGVQAHRRWTV